LRASPACSAGGAPAFPSARIAGIDAGNAGAHIAAGADGVAVISALSLADPQARRDVARRGRRRAPHGNRT
jgi:thiamine monophosphate synthase